MGDTVRCFEEGCDTEEFDLARVHKLSSRGYQCLWRYLFWRWNQESGFTFLFMIIDETDNTTEFWLIVYMLFFMI